MLQKGDSFGARGFLWQLIRLRETDAGKSLLERQAQHIHSRDATTLGRRRAELPYLLQSAPLPCSLAPLWNVAEPTSVEGMPNLRRKHRSPLVMRALAQYIEVAYTYALQVYPDASAHKSMR